jgi:hypothetical protein
LQFKTVYDCGETGIDRVACYDHDKCIEEKVIADGRPRCYMCGETMDYCEEWSAIIGFDECDWLAGK